VNSERLVVNGDIIIAGKGILLTGKSFSPSTVKPSRFTTHQQIMKKIFTLVLLALCSGAFAQQLGNLTVEKIMRDPKWMGVAPSNIWWSSDSKKVYFNWNPNNTDRDEMFSVTPTGIKPVKVSIDEQKASIPLGGEWNKKHTIRLFEKNGDIFLLDPKTGKIQQLTNTTDRESNASFSGDDSRIIFTRAENLYSLKLNGGELIQLTNFVHTGAAATAAPQAFAARGGGGIGGGARQGGGGGARQGGGAATTAGAQAKIKTESSILFSARSLR
jgi:hypothetical protein